MKFNVVLFTPKNYNHAGVFSETVDLIYFSLKKLNFEVTKSEKIINDRKNIILGINLLKFYPKKNFKFPDNSVIINFEAFEHKEFFDNYTVNFLKNYEVWDFNFFNA